MGFKNKYLVEGSMYTVEILEHTLKGTVTGHLIDYNLEALRMELGMSTRKYT